MENLQLPNDTHTYPLTLGEVVVKHGHNVSWVKTKVEKWNWARLIEVKANTKTWDGSMYNPHPTPVQTNLCTNVNWGSYLQHGNNFKVKSRQQWDYLCVLLVFGEAAAKDGHNSLLGE